MTVMASDYIPSSDFAMQGTYMVETADGKQMTLDEAKRTNTPVRKLIFQPYDAIQYNYDYTVVIDKSVKSAAGVPLGETKTITFTSEFGPLFANPLEVQAVCKGLYRYFTIKDVYCALRDAGQKALILLKMYPDINSSRYRPLLEIRVEYFPTTKYVVYEAAHMLLNTLYVKMTEGVTFGDSDFFTSEQSTALGDLKITEKWALDPNLFKLIQFTLKEVEEQRKFWMDDLLGRTRRGYAAPVSASFRQSSGSPPDRSI
jgi:hypothetical protein